MTVHLSSRILPNGLALCGELQWKAEVTSKRQFHAAIVIQGYRKREGDS